MTEPRHPIERVLDLVVYAPIGLVAGLGEEVPRLARQGRQAIENRVVVARWIGQLAVQQGKRELTRRLEALRAGDDTTTPSIDAVVVTHEPAAEPEVAPESAAAPAPAVDVDPLPSSDSLPIAGYESLAAQHVVQRLGGLDAAELELVRRFEAGHRARRTILAKIAQLQEG